MKLPGYKNPGRLSNLKLVVLSGGAVFIIPFLFSFSTIDPVLLIRFVAWTALTILLVLFLLIPNPISHPSSDFTLIHRAIFPIVIGYVVISALSLTQTTNLAEGIFDWLKLFLSFTFLYIACLILVHNKAGILFLTRSVIVSALVLGLIGICQYFRISFTTIPGNYVPYATMANKNLFASALFLMLPFILFGTLQFSRSWFGLSLVSLTGVTYGVAITETRAVWGAILISTAAILWVLLWHQKLNLTLNEKSFYLRRSLLVFVIILISSSAAVWSHSMSSNHFCLFSRHSQPADLKKASPPLKSIKSIGTLNGRLRLWRTSLRMIKAEPILGVGLGQWKIVWPAYEMSRKINPSGRGRHQTMVQRPHNDFLWVFSETGVLGFFGYVLFWGFLVFYSLRVIGNAGDAQKKLFALLMLFGIIGFAVISFFSFPKERIFHNIFFMLMAACLVVLYHQIFPIQKAVSRYKIFGLNFFLLTLLGFCWVCGYARFEAEAHAKKALGAYRVGDWQRVIIEIDKADGRYYNLDPTSTPLGWYRGMANFSLGKIKEAFGDFQNAYALHPYHIHVINNLGTCHAKLQDFDAAIDYYQRALDISPNFEKAILNLAAIYFQTGQYGQARESLLRCIKNNPKSRAAGYLEMVENKLEPIFFPENGTSPANTKSEKTDEWCPPP